LHLKKKAQGPHGQLFAATGCHGGNVSPLKRWRSARGPVNYRNKVFRMQCLLNFSSCCRKGRGAQILFLGHCVMVSISTVLTRTF
jgi:hypothetical protein